MQLHEGVVVGRKTCVDALLGERVATCVEMGSSLSGSSSKCLALQSECSEQTTDLADVPLLATITHGRASAETSSTCLQPRGRLGIACQ